MKKNIGKTVLFQVHLAALEGQVFEGTVERLSPSGKYVCIETDLGEEWFAVEKATVLEELKPVSKQSDAGSPSPQPSPQAEGAAAGTKLRIPARILQAPASSPDRNSIS